MAQDWDDEDDAPPHQPRDGPREQGRGADVVEGQHPEQLAEALNRLVEQGPHGLGGAVTAGNAGTAGADYHLGLRVGNPARDDGAQLVDVVRHHGALGQAMPRRLDPLLQRAAGFVVIQGTAVGDREHRDAHGDE